MTQATLIKEERVGLYGANTQDCKNISQYMLCGKFSWKTIYAQLRGDRELTPIVADAAKCYFEFKPTADTTHESIMNLGYERFKKFGFVNRDAILEEALRQEKLAESIEYTGAAQRLADIYNQENPLANSWDGIDLTEQQKADNRDAEMRVREWCN